jgi:hypothetical protein
MLFLIFLSQDGPQAQECGADIEFADNGDAFVD